MSTEKKPIDKKHKKNLYNLDLFISLVGKRVIVRYGGDKIASGILRFVTRYEISIIESELMIIPKHSIQSVSCDKTETSK